MGLLPLASKRLLSSSPAPVDQAILRKFLFNLGAKEEVTRYLRLFSSVESQKFAVIKVPDEIITGDVETLASSLNFLHRLGLFPIVVHGSGLEGHPDPALLRRSGQAASMSLVEGLEKWGTKARPLTGGVFTAQPDLEGRGARISGINLHEIQASIRGKSLPVVYSTSETVDGAIFPLDVGEAASEIAKLLKPLKVVHLSTEGVLCPDVPELAHSVVNLDEQFHRLMESQQVRKEVKSTLASLKQLLDALPQSSSVSVTSTTNLPTELFTHKGAGTLVRSGPPIRSLKGPQIDPKMAEELWGKFELWHPSSPEIVRKSGGLAMYFDDERHVFALVADPSGVAVLQELHVVEEYEDFNLRENVWERIRQDFAKLIWAVPASRKDKLWFFEHCQGSFLQGESHIFWYGYSDVLEVAETLKKINF